jgi:hypothetical protein
MKNNLDVIVTFAKLWGIVTCDSRDNEAIVNHLEGYDSEELANLFVSWTEEFMSIPEADLGDFFDEKMSDILNGIATEEVYIGLPVGYPAVELHSIEDVAKFIMEYGLKTDVKVLTANGSFVLDTFGIYLNRVADLNFRNKLLDVLMPMQLGVDSEGAVYALDGVKTPSKVIEHRGDVFEIVDRIPKGYLIWNIGNNMLEGYLPLCRYVNPGSSFRIDGNSLKAIKCEGAQVVLKAVGAGYETIEDMRQCIEENANAAFGSVESRDRELCIAAMPYMEELNWEDNNNAG